MRGVIMPNGGTVPSCGLCKHHTSTGIGEGFCNLHNFPVKSQLTLCSDLKWDFPFITKFLLWLKRNTVYVWVEFSYAVQNSTLPMYYHEKVKFSSIKEYASWSPEQREAAYKAVYERVIQAFMQKYADKS